MRTLLKKYFYRIAAACSGSLRGRAVILMYHSVSDSSSRLSVSPEHFERQMVYIAERYQPVFLSELIRRLQAGEDISQCVCVTFDDGYADVYETASPITRKHAIPISVFVATGLIGGTFRTSDGNHFAMLKEEEVRTMRASGLVEFFSHTRSHTTVTQVDLTRLDDEIDGARRDLERILGEDIQRIFAYPKGKISKEARAYLATHGWTAVGTERGLVHPGVDLLALPRGGVYSITTWAEFRTLFSRTEDWLRRCGR